MGNYRVSQEQFTQIWWFALRHASHAFPFELPTYECYFFLFYSWYSCPFFSRAWIYGLFWKYLSSNVGISTEWNSWIARRRKLRHRLRKGRSLYMRDCTIICSQGILPMRKLNVLACSRVLATSMLRRTRLLLSSALNQLLSVISMINSSMALERTSGDSAPIICL